MDIIVDGNPTGSITGSSQGSVGRHDRRFDAISHPKFVENARNVVLDGFLAEIKAHADLLVAQAFDDFVQDLSFSAR